MLSRILSVLLFCAGLFCLAQAQVPMTGCCKGAPGGGAAYVGPGDLTTFNIFASLRCYNNAYTGSVADVYAPADASHTLITCSSGGVINETIQPLATTCATSCTVKTFFDQSGANACSAAPCNLTDLTFSTIRPAYIISCNGSLPCLRFNSAATTQLDNSAYTIAQALSVTFVAKRTSGTTNTQRVIGSAGFYAGFANAANLTLFYANGASDIRIAANDNVWHSASGVYNGASSTASVDGTNGSASIGTGGISSIFVGCNQSNAECVDGDVAEIGVASGSFSGATTTALCHNQRIYWSTAGSC